MYRVTKVFMMINLCDQAIGIENEEYDLLKWPVGVGNPFAEGEQLEETIQKSQDLSALEETAETNTTPLQEEVNDTSYIVNLFKYYD